MRRTRLTLVAALMALAACGAPTRSAPEVKAVYPGAVAPGARRYVTVRGTGFDPSFSVDPATGQGAVDDGFTVTFAGQASPQVVWRSPTTLVAALPTGLAAGSATVAVIGPDGGQGEKTGALCVGAVTVRRRLSLVYHGPLGAPTAVNLESVPVAGGTPTVLATRAGVPGLHPFTVSPDGRTVVYLQNRPSGSKTEEQLVALHLGAGAAPILLHAEPAVSGRQTMDDLAFTPDGRTVVYVIGRKTLVAQAIPAGGKRAQAPTVLFAEPPGATEDVGDPAVDPTGTTVLFSRITKPTDTGVLVGERLALYTVPLAGGTPTALLDERDKGVSDGPGVYLPSGQGILLASDRMGLVVPAKVYGTDEMVPASNLFRLDPDTGTVTAVSPPTVEAFVQVPLAVSPDGRWAASSGVLLDLSHSMIDILLTDLKTGEVYRAVADVPGKLPTVDVDPAFSPDGRTLYATAVTFLGPVITKVESYAVAVPEKDPTLPVSNRTLPPTSVTTLPGIQVSPMEVDAYAGCGG